MRRLFVLCVLLAGCESFDPVGTYTGDVAVGAQIQTLVTGIDEQGHATVNNSSTTQARSGVSVVVRRVSEDRLELTLDDGCVVPLQQDPEPNEHNTNVPYDAQTSCPVQVEGYSGPMDVSGSANFGREDRTINIMFSRNVPVPADASSAGTVTGSAGYNFGGTRPED